MLVRGDQVRTVPVAAALGLLAAAGWALLAAGVVAHPSHDALLGGHHDPSPAGLVGFFAGWLLMVLAMMLPAEIPTILASNRDPRHRSPTWGAAATLVAVTCAVWTAFAAVALAGDAVLHGVVHSWRWLGDHATLIPAGVLLVAGAFHLSWLGRRLRHAARASDQPPVRHALACLGGCWALMLVMFAIGVGSLLWMAVLTAVMTVERSALSGRRLAKLTGVALLAAGLLTIVRNPLLA